MIYAIIATNSRRVEFAGYISELLEGLVRTAVACDRVACDLARISISCHKARSRRTSTSPCSCPKQTLHRSYVWG